tara:strand:- start:266 stop:679 length:414 start_codon:yes stop_codon:yes gene_type:complete
MVMAGSGFVLFRFFPDGVRFLGLVGPEFHQKRCSGTYDIPKGVIDAGETPYQTAIREAEEEAGYKITPNSVMAGPFKDSYLTIWLAQVYDEPIITPNPHTGIIEHEGYEWLKPEELLGDCYDYLRPTVEWAIRTISA